MGLVVPCVPNAVGPNCITLVDSDNDGVLSDIDPDDSNPCVPNAVGSNCITLVDSDNDLSLIHI